MPTPSPNFGIQKIIEGDPGTHIHPDQNQAVCFLCKKHKRDPCLEAICWFYSGCSSTPLGQDWWCSSGKASALTPCSCTRSPRGEHSAGLARQLKQPQRSCWGQNYHPTSQPCTDWQHSSRPCRRKSAVTWECSCWIGALFHQLSAPLRAFSWQEQVLVKLSYFSAAVGVVYVALLSALPTLNLGLKAYPQQEKGILQR